jgi:ParB-like chromosome segregation protein Spo0J
MSKPLKFHPLADLFPLMEGEEFHELVADIKKNGLREPIVGYEGKILDGRNRYRACLKAGVQPLIHQHHEGCEAIGDPAAYVRRHLTAEQKRALIAKVIAMKPEASDRQIAKQVKADHKTVARARAEAEDLGKLPHVETRTDTKGRKQPAKKRKAKERRNEKRREARRAKEEAERQAARAAATAKAKELIDEIGIDIIRRVIEALNEPDVWNVLCEEIEEALEAPGIGKTEPELVPAIEPITPDDDDLGIPEFLRRVPKAAAS